MALKVWPSQIPPSLETVKADIETRVAKQMTEVCAVCVSALRCSSALSFPVCPMRSHTKEETEKPKQSDGFQLGVVIFHSSVNQLNALLQSALHHTEYLTQKILRLSQAMLCYSAHTTDSRSLSAHSQKKR